MGAALPIPSKCDGCEPDCTPQQVPGPKGDPGDPCTPCADGINAFTVLDGGFSMPAEGGTIVTDVVEAAWMEDGQPVFIEFAGTMIVQGNPVGNSVTLLNPADTATGAYPQNAAPATPIPDGSRVSPGGVQGPDGSDATAGAPTDAQYYLVTAHPDLPSAIAIDELTDLPGLLFAQVNGIPIIKRIGVDVQAWDCNLDALAGLTGAADKLAYFTGLCALALTDLTSEARTLLSKATVSDMRTFLGVTGTILQMVSTSRNDAVGFTSNIPLDDTIPQNTEGTEILTLAITPSAGTSRIVIEAIINVGNISATNVGTIVCAFFQDAIADALAVSSFAVDCRTFDNQLIQVSCSHELVAGSTSARTYKLRMGGDDAGAATPIILNGTAGPARVFGGVARTWLRITEYAA